MSPRLAIAMFGMAHVEPSAYLYPDRKAYPEMKVDLTLITRPLALHQRIETARSTVSNFGLSFLDQDPV